VAKAQRPSFAASADPSVAAGSTTRSAPAEAPYPSAIYGWFVVSVLILASILSFVDRQIVAIVADSMKTDLGVGDAQIGLLYGIFAVFYAIAGLPLAWMADRYSRKHIIAAGIFFWSLATVVCGLSRSFWQVLLARIGVGIGEASLVPATNTLVSDLFPRSRIPFVMSVFQTGAIMGSGLAFIVVGAVLAFAEQNPAPSLPVLASLAPWQLTFIYVGAPGFLLTFVILMLREPARRVLANLSTGQSAGQPGSGAAGIRDFYHRNLRMFVLHHVGFLSLAMMGYGFVFWSVPFFSRVHGMAAASAAQIFGWIFLVFGPLGSIWLGWYATRLGGRGRQDANISAAILAASVSLPLVVLIQLMPTPTWAFILYAPALFFVNAPFGLAYGSLMVIAPPTMRALVAAIYMLTVSIGMLAGPPLAGLFNEQLFPQADGVRYSVMAMAAIFGVIGIGCLLGCRQDYARCMAEADALEART
jgi:MFS family permease